MVLFVVFTFYVFRVASWVVNIQKKGRSVRADKGKFNAQEIFS